MAKYSASTGAFLKGYNFDTDETRLGVGVAVDPTGQHVYVGDEPNPFVGRTTARIYEFDVSRLHEVRRFALAGNDVGCDLAVTPDGHLFAQVGPPHGTQVLFQEYSSTGGYENQFISPPGGLAIGPGGTSSPAREPSTGSTGCRAPASCWRRSAAVTSPACRWRGRSTRPVTSTRSTRPRTTCRRC